MLCFFHDTHRCEGKVEPAEGAADSPWSELDAVDSTFGYCEFHRTVCIHRARWEGLFIKFRPPHANNTTKRTHRGSAYKRESERVAA